MGVWKSIRRPDWLAELQAVLGIGLAVISAFGVVDAVGILRAESLRVDAPASQVTGEVDHGLRPGITVADNQDLAVVIADPGLRERATYLLTVLPSMLAVLVLLALMFRLVRHARRSDPFTRATVRQLRVLAVVALVGGYLAVLVEMFAELELSGLVVQDALFATINFLPYWLLVFFGLLAMAEVVNRGCSMRDELATVI